MPPFVGEVARLGRQVATRVRNQVTATGFGDRAIRNGMIPNGGVAVFFATGPDNLYQFEQWRLPLQELALTRPVFVVVDRPDTGELILGSSTLPVVLARGSAALEELVGERDVRVVLYLNQVEPNFRMLRFNACVHVQIGHGESDKAGSVSHQHQAYDLTFVAGTAGQARLGQALRSYDPAERTRTVGRPQLDHDHPGAPDWTPGEGLRVFYAPTWEGDRPSIAYGSLASHGVGLVEALLAEPDLRVIYRPHPRTGRSSPEHAGADARIRRLLSAAGDRHLVDQGSYGWQWRFADACITDISAVAYDWLATGKPLLVTEPAASTVVRPPSRLLDELPLLGPEQVFSVVQRLRTLGLGGSTVNPRLAGLTDYYFGETADRASTRRFAEAIDQAYAMAAQPGR